MDSRTRRGTTAEDAIAKALGEFGAVPVQIPNQRDTFSRDLLVQVERRDLTFFVQAKALTSANLQIDGRQIERWMAQREPTLLIWWDESSDRLYWASLWHRLFRRTGLPAKTTTFSQRHDLRLLERQNEASWRAFLEFVERLVTLWHVSYDFEIEYPPRLVNILARPDALPYVPVPPGPVRSLEQFAPTMTPITLRAALMRAAYVASGSGSQAIDALSEAIPLDGNDAAVLTILRPSIDAWLACIPRETSPTLRLLALDTLLQMVDDSAPTELTIGSFNSSLAWPLCSLVKLLPATFMIQRLEKILLDGQDPNARLYAAYLLGNLEFADAGDHLAAIARSLQRSTRRELWGKHGQFVIREAEWAAAKQGSEMARDAILTGMDAGPTLETQVLLNWEYFGATERSLEGVQRHMQGLFRGDDFLKKPLGLLFDGMARGIQRGILRN